MKTLLIWLGLCLAFVNVRAEEPTGIKFFTGTWKAALAEAKRQNKPVFVDIYTTWCGPCKLMAKQAFPDAKVGEKFNANFINYQIDAEKGEGINVAKQYAVTAYPTSLYLTADGNLIHRAIGYGGIPGLLDEADKAIVAAKDPMPLSVMEADYKKGKHDPEFLYSYLKKRAGVGLSGGKALDEYLATLSETELISEKNVSFFSQTVSTMNSKAYSVLMAELPAIMKYEDKQAGGDVFSSLQRAMGNDMKKAIAGKNEQLMDKIIKNDRQSIVAFRPAISNADLNQRSHDLKTLYYLKTNNIDGYRVMTLSEADNIMAAPNVQPAQKAMQLNNLAWTYYENMTDPKDLNQALAWSAKSLEYDRQGMNLDTYAHLLSKLGRKAEAIKTQEEAIAAAKAKNEDAANYEKALAEMKQK